MNIIFNSLLAQLIKYDVHTAHKINFIHAIFHHILLLSASSSARLSVYNMNVALMCFNLVSDNERNTIRVIWYYVMLYNCLVAFQP